MQDSYGNQPASEAPEEQVEKKECNLVEVKKGLEDTTKILVEDFSEGRIDATVTMAGLQLVQDARDACTRGDPQVCGWLQLIKRFLERTHKESLH